MMFDIRSLLYRTNIKRISLRDIYILRFLIYAQDVKQLFAYVTGFYNIVRARSFDHIIKTLSRNE